MTSPRNAEPQICPYLYYADADAAIDWLVKSFGFRVQSAFRTPEGRVVHAQLEVGERGLIFVGPGMEYFGTRGVENPDAVHAALYVYVDDLESHLERSRACGAKIRAEISDKGRDRIYAASDPQGQRWVFAQPK